MKLLRVDANALRPKPSLHKERVCVSFAWTLILATCLSIGIPWLVMIASGVSCGIYCVLLCIAGARRTRTDFWSVVFLLIGGSHIVWILAGAAAFEWVASVFFAGSHADALGELWPLVMITALVYGVVLAIGSPLPLITAAIMLACLVTGVAIGLPNPSTPVLYSIALLHLAIGACLTLDWLVLRTLFPHAPNLCGCGYDMAGLTSNVCPECGKQAQSTATP